MLSAVPHSIRIRLSKAGIVQASPALVLCALLLSPLPALTQPQVATELNLGGPVLSWRPDPLAQGYSIQHAGAPEQEWSPLAVMTGNSFFPELGSGFFRVTPLYSRFLSITDTLHFQVKATCEGWTDPAGQGVVDVSDYSIDLIDAGYADTLCFYPDQDGLTLIPIRSPGKTVIDALHRAAGRFRFRLNSNPTDIAALFSVPKDLRLEVKPSLWFVFQVANGDWEKIVAADQLLPEQAEMRIGGFLRVPGSWYNSENPAAGDTPGLVQDESTAATHQVDTREWLAEVPLPEPALPVEPPANATWLTRAYDGVVQVAPRVGWAAGLLTQLLASSETVAVYEFETERVYNKWQIQKDRIRGPPHSS